MGGVAVASNDVATNLALYTEATNNNPWVGTALATAGKSTAVTNAGIIGKITRVWDPIMAAQRLKGDSVATPCTTAPMVSAVPHTRLGALPRVLVRLLPSLPLWAEGTW